jgi:hypothetical protein
MGSVQIFGMLLLIHMRLRLRSGLRLLLTLRLSLRRCLIKDSLDEGLRTSDDNDEIQGSFTAFRMTT